MGESERILSILRDELPGLRQRFFVERIALYGSCARDAARPDSDADVLVAFSRPVDYFVLVHLEEYLAGCLGRPVDVVTEDGLSPFIRPYIVSQLRYAA